MKTEYYQQIHEFRNKKEEAKQKLNQLQEDSEDAWEELKEGIENSWKILGNLVKSASEDFK